MVNFQQDLASNNKHATDRSGKTMFLKLASYLMQRGHKCLRASYVLKLSFTEANMESLCRIWVHSRNTIAILHMVKNIMTSHIVIWPYSMLQSM